MSDLLAVVIAAMLPVSELRGAIPLGIGLGLDWVVVFGVSVLFNVLMFFPIYFGLKLFYENFFSRIGLVRKLIERSRRKVGPLVEKYGVLGIAVFVAIPLPVTGLWTGTAAAWVLGLDWKRSFLAAALGVFIAGIIVSVLTLGFVSVSPSLYGVLVK